jgi:hypothetical protein
MGPARRHFQGVPLLNACDQQAQISCCGDEPQLTLKVSSFDETHQRFFPFSFFRGLTPRLGGDASRYHDRSGLRGRSTCSVRFFDLVGQFVAVVAGAWKIFSELFAGVFDAFHQAFGEFAFFETRFHRGGEQSPKSVAAFFVNAGVADNREAPRARREKDQDAIARGGLGHAESIEVFLRGRDGIRRFLAGEEHANLTGRA